MELWERKSRCSPNCHGHQPCLWCCYWYGPEMARVSSCQGQPTGSSYWRCHQHSCQLLARESSNYSEETPPFLQAWCKRALSVPGNISQFSLWLWTQLYCVTMLQIYSVGRKEDERDWLRDFDQFFSKNCWGEAMTSPDSCRVSLEAYNLAFYYILTCLFIVCLCQ